MYYPYFRGKQFELLAIKEMAQLLARKKIVPLIEPVRESLNGLSRTLDAIETANGRAIVIVNPRHGDHREDGEEITAFLDKGYLTAASISAGILLHNEMSVDEAMVCFREHKVHQPVLVHAGFNEPKELAHALSGEMKSLTHVFIEKYADLLYRKHFQGTKRILIRDGFNRQSRNADYPPLERFSELHLTYQDLGMDGFGDFLIVGDAYSEGGGPAYAVAIHLTFIDPERDDVMYIHHFVSDTKDAPSDTAGKFAQALARLIKTVDSGHSPVSETEAIREFRDLHERGHSPGLGPVKKLSMKHHLEILADYIS